MLKVPRYFRSPEFLLAAINVAITVPLITTGGIDALTEKLLVDIVSPIATSFLPPPWEEWFILGGLVVSTAPLMFPLSTVVLIAVLAEIFNVSEWHPTFTYVSIPNAVIWGFLVAFTYRLLKTGDVRRTYAATLFWKTGRDITAAEPCPHCGQPMPRTPSARTRFDSVDGHEAG